MHASALAAAAEHRISFISPGRTFIEHGSLSVRFDVGPDLPY
jgi:hypothetical protein